MKDCEVWSSDTCTVKVIVLFIRNDSLTCPCFKYFCIIASNVTLVSNISVSLLLMLPLFPVFTFASDLTLFFFLDSCFPLNGRPRNIRKELRKTGKHSCFERKLLYLVTLTVQAAVPGDSVNCYTWWFWQCRLLYLVILAVLTAIPGDSDSADCYTWSVSYTHLTLPTMAVV